MDPLASGLSCTAMKPPGMTAACLQSNILRPDKSHGMAPMRGTCLRTSPNGQPASAVNAIAASAPNVPQWPVAVEARSPAAALIAVNVSEVDDVGRELMKRLRRPKRVSSALPPPVASGPYPTVAVPDPASRNPCCAHIRCRDICARHPDILDAIPAPVAGLPDISGGRRGGHRLDHGRGRGNADDHANARETGTGSERQCRSAEKGKDRSSVHAGDPGSCFSSVKPSTDAAGVRLDGRQQLLNFRLHENAIGRNDARHVA